ncbi:hypothetical protein GGI11_006703, partial [Coemansia sp. RSA 2049]
MEGSSPDDPSAAQFLFAHSNRATHIAGLTDNHAIPAYTRPGVDKTKQSYNPSPIPVDGMTSELYAPLSNRVLQSQPPKQPAHRYRPHSEGVNIFTTVAGSNSNVQRSYPPQSSELDGHPEPGTSADSLASTLNSLYARLRMLGQLKAVAVVSTGSVHYSTGQATQIPVKLRNRKGVTLEVELFDRENRLIGTLEQSITRTIHALLADGNIKVVGLVSGPLRGKFVSPILLSFYADQTIAQGVIDILEQSGLYLDQSAIEVQNTLRDMGVERNILTQGISYTAMHPTRDADGLLTLSTNSDNHLSSVFANMGLRASGHVNGTGTYGGIFRMDSRFGSQPLPSAMVVDRRESSSENTKTRIADIKSTFVTLLDLPELEAPTYITTPLRRHQKQALYFMVHRETDGVDIEKSDIIDVDSDVYFPKLWVRITDTPHANREEYRHALVNIRCVDRPDPMLGGILADDMGLGKTLSVLALVAKLPSSRRPCARMKFADGESGLADKADDSSSGPSSASISRRNGRFRSSRRPKKNKGYTRIARRKKDGGGIGFRRTEKARGKMLKSFSRGSSDNDSELNDFVDDVVVEVQGDGSRFPKDAEAESESVLGVYPDSAASDSSLSSLSSGFLNTDLDGSSDSEDEYEGSAIDEEDYYDRPLDDRPMTPPPEFDNPPTKKKEECERRFSENYHGRYAGGTLIVCPL